MGKVSDGLMNYTNLEKFITHVYSMNGLFKRNLMYINQENTMITNIALIVKTILSSVRLYQKDKYLITMK